MEKFKAVLSLPKVAAYGKRRIHSVTLELELRKAHWYCGKRTVELEPAREDLLELTICGEIKNGNGGGFYSGGQNISEVVSYYPTKRLQRIQEIWERYHLNGMKAGTSKQKEVLDAHKKTLSKKEREEFNQDHYANCLKVLEAAGLKEDRGYTYGSAWLIEEIPADIIEEIKALFQPLSQEEINEMNKKR